MREAGIREVRQRLSALLEIVKKGGEITVTDRGQPVARLVPPVPAGTRAFPDLAEFRAKMPALTPPLSATLDEDRADRV